MDTADMDASARERLAQLRSRDPFGWHDGDAPISAQDVSGTLILTIDPTRRVVGVFTPDLDDTLRTPAALAAACAQAFRRAVSAQISANDPGLAAFSGPPVIPEPRERPRRRVVFDDPIAAGRTVRPEYWALEGSRRGRRNDVGLSDNRCVTVTLKRCNEFGTIEADAGWLTHADPAAVGSSVHQAFTAAYRRRDHHA
jgi:hypothetical protein